MIIFLLLFFFISFYISCITVRSKFNPLVVLVFVIFSVIIRYTTPLIENADYNTYLRFVEFGELFNISFATIFSEPYLFIVVLSLKKVFRDTAMSLDLYYAVNFFISTLFFIWIIRLRDVQTFSKVLIFSSYYFLFTYTTI